MEPSEQTRNNQAKNSELELPTLNQEAGSSDAELPTFDVPNIVLVRKIGEGARGRVYLGKHRLLESDVAVKVLQAQTAEDKSWTERFLREGQILSKLEHPNIVRLFSYGMSADSEPYIVMEYLSGKNLESYIQENGPLSLEQAIEITKQLVSALTTVHQAGVVHRDIKPGNIIIIKESGNPVLLDFGVSKITSEESVRLTATSRFVGTPAYMSPEQSKGKAVDHLSDQYSLACVFCFMVSGRTLFEAANDMELMLKQYQEKPDLNRLKLTSGVQRVLARALEKKPEDRFATLTDFADQLLVADRTKKGRKLALSMTLYIAGGLLIVASTLALYFAHTRESELSNTAEREKASKQVLSRQQRKHDEMKFKEIGKRHISRDFDGARTAAREFLHTPTAMSDPLMREKGLGLLAAYLSRRPECADEYLNLLKEQLNILETSRGTHSDILQNFLSRRVDVLVKILGCYQFNGRLKEGKRYVDKLKELIASAEFSTKNPANEFESLYFESQYLWAVGKDQDALLADKKVLEALRHDPFDEKYSNIEKFFVNMANHWTKSSTVSPDCLQLVNELVWWLEYQGSSAGDLSTVLTVYDSLARSGSKKNLEAGNFLLKRTWLLLRDKIEFVPANEKLKFLYSVLQRWNGLIETRETCLSLNQVNALKEGFLSLLTKETIEKSEPRSIVDTSIILAKRFVELDRKPDAVEVMEKTRAAVVNLAKFDPSQKMYLQSNVISIWSHEGTPIIGKEKALSLSGSVSKVLDEEIRAIAINRVSSDTVGMMRDLLVAQKCIPQSLKFVRSSFDKVNANASISVECKLLFLDLVFQSVQTPDSPILSASESETLRKQFMDLHLKYNQMKTPEVIRAQEMQEIQKRLEMYLSRAQAAS